MPDNINDLIRAAGVKYLNAPPPVTAGQQTFTTGSSWVVPTGVTSICAVAIARGENGTDFGDGTYRSGIGGNLRYVNDIAVTPGETLTVAFQSAYYPSLARGGTILLRAGLGDVGTGFNGGNFNQSSSPNMAGAGAGGYTSAGANSATSSDNGLGGGGSSLLGGAGGAAAGVAPTADGALYGGGGAISGGVPAQGGAAGLRIIWGAGRAFPNTNTGNV